MSFEIAASGTFVTLLISCQNQLTQSQIHPSIQHIHLNTVPCCKRKKNRYELLGGSEDEDWIITNYTC